MRRYSNGSHIKRELLLFIHNGMLIRQRVYYMLTFNRKLDESRQQFL